MTSYNSNAANSLLESFPVKTSQIRLDKRRREAFSSLRKQYSQGRPLNGWTTP